MVDLASQLRTAGEAGFSVVGYGPSGSNTPTGAVSYTNIISVYREDSINSRLEVSRILAPIGYGLYPVGPLCPVQASVMNGHTVVSSEADTITVPLVISGSTYYRLRARDASGPLTDITRYVFWTSLNPSLASYSGSLPFGGPLVELTILSSWSQ